MQFSKGEVVLEKYRVLFPIKDARNAETYRVLDEAGNLCFLKIFNPSLIQPQDLDGDGELKELSLAGLVHHPSVPRLLESGRTHLNGQSVPFGMFDFVPGETMLDMRRRVLAVEASDVRKWMLQLLKAVTYMHELPEVVCHNQLDLTNIMLDSRGEGAGDATVIDFGHAHSAFNESNLEHQLQGHDPYFLAPECFDGEFSPASDVFALGAIYYNLVFGMPPWNLGLTAFQATQADMKEKLGVARAQPLTFPNLGGGLMPGDADLMVIRKALHPEKEHRFETASEMLEAMTGEVKLTASDVPAVSEKVVSSCGLHGFDAIAGMAELKETLASEVLGPLREPEKYRSYGLSIPNGMLLYGPPGCGKTFVSERFAEEARLAFRKIVPSDLASIYVHGSQEKIGKLFDEARQMAPCILFFDEFDALLPNREGAGVNPGAASEVNEFLAQMSNCSEAGVFIMGATNRPELIDPAVLRTGRLDKKIYVSPPDFEARKAMFILHLSKRPVGDDVDYDELAHMTEKRVSSDIKFLVDEASRRALRADSKITQAVLKSAIQESKPSMDVSEIDRYEAMRNSMNDGDGGAATRSSIGFQFGVKSDQRP